MFVYFFTLSQSSLSHKQKHSDPNNTRKKITFKKIDILLSLKNSIIPYLLILPHLYETENVFIAKIDTNVQTVFTFNYVIFFPPLILVNTKAE